MRRLGLSDDTAHRISARAAACGTPPIQHLLASGLADEQAIFALLASELGVAYVDDLGDAQIILREPQRLAALRMPYGPPILTIHTEDERPLTLLSGADLDLPAWRARLARQPELAARVAVAPPSLLRESLIRQTRRRLLFDAQFDLFLNMPEFSARTVLSAWQGAAIAIGIILLPIGLALIPTATLLSIQLLSAVTFLGCLALRIRALPRAAPPRLRRPRTTDPGELPVYSVLVALYREKEMVPQLLAALGRLQWPRDKLDIKLICEEDDNETLGALSSLRLRPWIEVLRVPAALPRTKPKALAYALPLCRGSFITLFDAEDRPHPEQLREAWQHFRGADDTLGCVQAPLVIANRSASAAAMMFAFEYAGLFRGLLPDLAARGDVLPLGGTSNHFRREALVECGGWDPHNVTEDADLGLRLRRLGYRTDVISLPTLEDAPETLREWMPQRVRWFKGWILTWLVHMRSPVALLQDLGLRSFLTTQVLFAGMVLSALVHPVFLATIIWSVTELLSSGEASTTELIVTGAALTSIVAGYSAFIAIGTMTLTRVERTRLPAIIALTPFYWLLLSVAAWLAVVELWRNPHRWNKTPHRPARRPPGPRLVSAGRPKAGR